MESGRTTADAVVIGGGLVGAAVAYGFTRAGLKPVMLDEGDVAYRASRGNFALIWTQSKGAGANAYQQWSRLSSDLWGGFADELKEVTGIDCGHRRNGGLHICLTEAEFQKRRNLVEKIRKESEPGTYQCDVLSRSEMLVLLPDLGPTVVGGTYCAQDGTTNPLLTLRALHQAFLSQGGRYFCEAPAQRIEAGAHRFVVHAGGKVITAPILVLAAGLGNKALGAMVGLNVPVEPVRGQIIVTERAKPFLNYPTTCLRQSVEGTVLIGESREDAGFDDTTNSKITHSLAERAIRTFPLIRSLGVIRTWAALRVMSPDSHPIYDQSGQFPGAFVCTCHSGVTLAAVHAHEFSKSVAAGGIPQTMTEFSARRFDVQIRH